MDITLDLSLLDISFQATRRERAHVCSVFGGPGGGGVPRGTGDTGASLWG